VKLKVGVEIEHKKKRYVGEVPDEVFKDMFGDEEAEKRKKYQFVEPEPEPEA
jgi:hypothetical protein